MALGKWNWEQEDWPQFRYDQKKLDPLETDFLLQGGVLSGTVKHVGDEDRDLLVVDLISNEAMKTSEIEGEVLNRESVQSSIRRQFGFPTDGRKVPPAEQGIAEMMTSLYRHFEAPLTNETLFAWHTMLTNGRRDLHDIGRYRTGTNPMQVISGAIDNPKVHFEAPPSEMLPREMDRFLDWFISTAPGGENPLPALTRAGIAHLYFVSVHPFEDGNGRIGRAIAEKSLAESLGHPTLIALSQTINSRRKLYYDSLELNNQSNEITDWLVYFARTVLDAQRYTQKLIDRLIDKAKFFEQFRGRLNERQEKALVRMFREEPDGFKGGMSAEKYIRITGASRATATRDLQDLVEKEALTRTGALKGTRYHLPSGRG